MSKFFLHGNQQSVGIIHYYSDYATIVLDNYMDEQILQIVQTGTLTHANG